MRCQYCGAQLQDADTFCTSCGKKVVRKPAAARICPNCGAVLRDGAAFCHKCGCSLEEAPANNRAARRRSEEAPRQEDDSYEEDDRYDEDASYDEDDGDEEEDDEEDYEDEDYEDDDEDDEEGSPAVRNVMILIGIIILLVAGFAAFMYYRALTGTGVKQGAAQSTVASEAAASTVGIPASEKAAGTVVVTGTASLNVRSKADKGSAVVTVVNEGDELTYYSHDGAWYLIKTTDGKEGYVSDKYVKEK